MMQSEVKKIKAAVNAKPKKKAIPDDNYCSTGVPLLNLAVSGRIDGGIPKGTYLYYVGDSSSGKTWFSMELMAQACINRNFDNHRLIFDNAERGALMDVRRYFGKLADRIEPPKGTRAKPEYSRITEEFYYNLDDALEEGPCIYVLDSMDSLTTNDDDKKFDQFKDRYQGKKKSQQESEGEEKLKGSYGMAQAKINSRNIRGYAAMLDDTGSILVIISQTRDKVGSQFPMRTHAGGKALKFFSHVEVWTSVKGDIKWTNILGKDRVVGSRILMDVQKNRITGWDSFKIEVPFHRSVGLDPIGASVDFLIDEGFWPEEKKVITAEQFGFKGKREQLIERIEGEDGESELHGYVQEVWDKIDAACAVKRKPRY
jgi:RecA/RadA recombinase